MAPPRSDRTQRLPTVHWVCGTSDLEIAWGYAKQVEIVVMTRSGPGQRLRLSSRFVGDAPDWIQHVNLSLSAPSTALVANLEGSGLQFTMEV